MPWYVLLSSFIVPFAAAALLTGLLLIWLRRIALLDRPNERSLHTVPTPRGGGLAMVSVLIAAFAVIERLGQQPALLQLPLVGAVLLVIVGWRDDRSGLTPLAKLVPQLAAVGLGLGGLADAGLVFQGWLPQPVDLALAALLWLWFVNLYNFMDGSDGLAAGEAAAIGLGLAVIGWWFGWPGDSTARALALAGAALGFLLWNRPPARVFLGDAGSLPLGFLIGWLLLVAAAQGHWAVALILPSYFLLDATLTLALRAARGENLFTAHTQHFYQQGVRGRLGHRGTLLAVLAADLVLIAFAFGAEKGELVAGLVGAAATTVYLLRYLTRPASPDGK